MRKIADIVKSIRGMFKQNIHSSKESQNRNDVTLTGLVKDEYPSFYEVEKLIEKDDTEWDTVNDDFFSQPPRITSAMLLPSGWVWVDYVDGSGHLQSPNEKHYFFVRFADR